MKRTYVKIKDLEVFRKLELLYDFDDETEYLCGKEFRVCSFYDGDKSVELYKENSDDTLNIKTKLWTVMTGKQ